eukprot:scaffold26636_cov153-Skeletonema_menzelii.AAC.24
MIRNECFDDRAGKRGNWGKAEKARNAPAAARLQRCGRTADGDTGHAPTDTTPPFPFRCFMHAHPCAHQSPITPHHHALRPTPLHYFKKSFSPAA